MSNGTGNAGNHGICRWVGCRLGHLTAKEVRNPGVKSRCRILRCPVSAETPGIQGPNDSHQRKSTHKFWCAVQSRVSSVGANPTRQLSFQPVAIGAAVEVTKLLKPSVERVALGDSASAQAVTRVNAEQASKRVMREPTRPEFGEGRRGLEEEENDNTQAVPPG